MTFSGLFDSDGARIDLCGQYSIAGLSCPASSGTTSVQGRTIDSFPVSALLQAANIKSLDAPLSRNSSLNRCDSISLHVLSCAFSLHATSRTFK